jgi:hypothetical protein
LLYDAAYANEVNYKSRSGYCCLIGGSLVSWYSAAQSVVAQSSAEAEYYAAVAAANECIWFKQLLKDLGFKQQTIEIFEDNLACIALTKNPEDHKRTKHIQVKHHVIRDYVAKRVWLHLPTAEQAINLESVSWLKNQNYHETIGTSSKGGELEYSRKSPKAYP